MGIFSILALVVIVASIVWVVKTIMDNWTG